MKKGRNRTRNRRIKAKKTNLYKTNCYNNQENETFKS